MNIGTRWKVLLGTIQHEPGTARLIGKACVCLHNLKRIGYPSLQNTALDYEDDNYDIVPGAWWQCANMHDVDQAKERNRDSTAAKKQREYLKLYFNSAAGSVIWPDRMI